MTGARIVLSIAAFRNTSFATIQESLDVPSQQCQPPPPFSDPEPRLQSLLQSLQSLRPPLPSSYKHSAPLQLGTRPDVDNRRLASSISKLHRSRPFPQSAPSARAPKKFALPRLTRPSQPVSSVPTSANQGEKVVIHEEQRVFDHPIGLSTTIANIQHVQGNSTLNRLEGTQNQE